MKNKGRHVIVTGVSKGIGKSIVQDLLQTGFTVHGWGRSNNDIEHDNYHFYPTDVTQFDSVETSFHNTLKVSDGRVDGLINNAGLGYFKKLHEMEIDEWKTMYATNVDGIFHTCKLVIPIMREQGSGHIINVASIAGLTGIPEASGYCGTKHAVRGISHSLYKELRKKGIKVSCVYPGSVNTEFFDHYDGVNPNDTMLSPKDISQAVCYLLNTSNNTLVVDVEIRPINPSYS